MGTLNGIKDELQHIVETIHAITSIDITIVNSKLQRLVATKGIEQHFGLVAPQNSVFQKCIDTGKQYFIENPRDNIACRECVQRRQCQELAELCIPIKFDNKIIGVLGMCALDKTARDSLMNNKGSYLTFESQLSTIISTMLQEKENSTLLEHRSSELITLLNSVNEGIMFLDNGGRILTCNRYINERLQSAPKATHLRDLVTAATYEQLTALSFRGEVGPERINGMEFIIYASPIISKEKQVGIVLVFSDFTQMRQSVLTSVQNRNMVTFDDILGESEPFLAARQMAIQVAKKDVAVLLVGETGTGKDLFAEAIHNGSHRKNELFLPLNCSAIPENLIESELFGYEKGSFTGASPTGRKRKFEICKKGTLFLDEIGDLPYPMQAKLLRALEKKEITRVGGHALIQVDPRIISASHKDLQAMVAQNTFREDLYYRLNVVPIHIPPLRERGYDVIILARHFVKHFAQVHNKFLQGLTAECEGLLMGYSYPGNIRELRNLIEYGVIFEKGISLGVGNIIDKMSGDYSGKNLTLAEMTKNYERGIIKDQMKNFGHSQAAKQMIASRLSISIATLYRKLKE